MRNQAEMNARLEIRIEARLLNRLRKRAGGRGVSQFVRAAIEDRLKGQAK